jgi:hypothetical protein
MLKKLVEKLSGLENIVSVSHAEWTLRHTWPGVVLFLLVLASIAFSVWSYRVFRNRTLGWFMTALRALALAVVVSIFFEPVLSVDITRRVGTRILVMLDSSESMGIRDTREHDHDIAESALALGLMATPGMQLTPAQRKQAQKASRFALARGILTNAYHGLIGQLEDDYEINTFRFGEGVSAIDRDGKNDNLAALTPNDKATALGAAMRKAAASFSGESIVGMIVLSDFAWNRGEDPLGVADHFKDRGIPAFPIGIGLVEPPDVSVERIYTKDLLFAGDSYTVKVQIQSTPSFARSSGSLVIKVGDVTHNRMITLEGDHQVEEFTFEAPDAAGIYPVEASVNTMGDEAVVENNTLARTVKVTDEKIRVLYVEGLPRWEYRYLRWVLLRDHRLDVRFLMSQGDRDLAAHSPFYLHRFPQAGDAGLDFDLVILGDVPATYFNTEQIRWMEELVSRRGGSLLMISGPSYAPHSYRDTAIGDLLPVTIKPGAWQIVNTLESPTVTEAGFVSRVPMLTDEESDTTEIWEKTRPLRAVPPVVAKPGASVLMGLSALRMAGEPYPFLAWQRYGNGKSMFLASGKIWRIRYNVGRKHHERFWAQTIQFLALSRLHAGNKRVTIETDSREYGTSESIKVFANVLNPFLDPVRARSYTVHLSPVDQPEEAEPIRLSPVPGVPGFYEGSTLARESGYYRLLAPETDRESANSPNFEVRDISLELRNPGMRIDVARRLAERSEGIAAGSFNELQHLVGSIRAQSPLRKEHIDVELWDTPLVYVLILLFAGLEWVIRRIQRMV